MKHWIEYSAEGEIFFAGRGLALPAPQRGGTVIETPDAVDPTRSVFIGGELHDVGPQPSLQHVLDFASREWVLWTPPGVSPLRVLQDARWSYIKDEREKRTFGGFTWSGHAFDSDAVSAQKIAGAAQLAQLALASETPFNRVWTLADNSTIELDAQDMIAVMLAMGAHVGSVHDTGTALRATIYAADATEASVAAVEWPE